MTTLMAVLDHYWGVGIAFHFAADVSDVFFENHFMLHIVADGCVDLPFSGGA